jgi:hypothetical protein
MKPSQPNCGFQIQRSWTRARAVNRAVNPVYAPIRSQPPVLDPTVLIMCERDAVVGTSERPVARRRLTGVTSGRRSWPPNRPRVGATRSEATRARDSGVKERVRASTTAGTGRERRGCSGEVVCATVRP